MTRTLAVRILALAIAAGVAADVLLPGNAAGVNAPILVGLVLVAAFLAAGPAGLRRMDPADAWMAPSALAFATLVAVRADRWLVELDVLAAMALSAGAVAALGGARITRGTIPAVVEAAVRVSAACALGAVSVVGEARRAIVPTVHADAVPTARTARRRIPAAVAPVIRGVALAVPLLVLFGLLFASADAVFDRTARMLLDLQVDVDLTDAAQRTAVVVLVAWLVAGLLALGAAGIPWLGPLNQVPRERAGGGPAPRSLGAASALDLPAMRRSRAVEATTVLVCLDLLFAGFAALQVAYLFGGRDTLATAGLTYAEYARRGFFELVAVAALAGLVVVALDLAVGHRPRAQLGAALVLLGLTSLVLASAFLRLRLYQDAYGWTELRFVVLVAIGWLGAGLVTIAVLLAARRSARVLHAMGILALLALAAMNLAGPGATVTVINLQRALDPTLVPAGGRTGLDAEYLAGIGDEAVPAVVGAIGRLPDAADRDALETFLRERAAALRDDPALLGWPAWNAARERAREALRAFEGSGSAFRGVSSGDAAR